MKREMSTRIVSLGMCAGSLVVASLSVSACNPSAPDARAQQQHAPDESRNDQTQPARQTLFPNRPCWRRGCAERPHATFDTLHPLHGRDTGIRGVTVGPIENSLWPGRGYGSPHSAALLDELQRLGVTWISITPFGRIWSLQSSEIFLDFEANFEENAAAVIRFAEQAHARGMSVLLIPHLWVWNERGWRGEIALPDDAAWRRFHDSYKNFVMTWARIARLANVEAFSVGVECKSWSGRFGLVWRDLIAQVRQTLPDAKLTYSANWDEAPGVLFWQQLDWIGINAFYPLADHHGATLAEYEEGARRNRERVREVHEVLNMPVVFVEVGYTTRLDAAVEPWLWPEQLSGTVISEHEQSRALLASLRAFVPEPWFQGFFVWRYYASIDDVSQEPRFGFSPHAKRTEHLLQSIFGSEFAADQVNTPAPNMSAVGHTGFLRSSVLPSYAR